MYNISRLEKMMMGVKFNMIDLRGVLYNIENYVRDGGRHQVCVTNVYSLVLMQKDKEFRAINNNADLVVADGMPIVWISKMFGNSIPERVSGPDLFFEFCKIAANKGYKFFFLGSTNEILNSMCCVLKKKFPNIQVIGTYAPPFRRQFTQKDNSNIINAINKRGPDILWVGMTAPKQEKWIYNNMDKLKIKVAIGIGAAFDFIAGNKKRAPLWIQKSGLEWLWRLLQEPKRLWKRYLIGNTIFISLVLRELLKRILMKGKT